jgi:hypothetical protein
MQKRVDGIGPVKITALKEAGFVIEATRDRREAEEETTLLRAVRGQVDVMRAQTWRHREDLDLYTKQRRRVVETLTPEVDHVWECQIINFVNSQVVKDNPAYHTRAMQNVLRIVMNSVQNLNVTTHEVNQRKRDRTRVGSIDMQTGTHRASH